MGLNEIAWRKRAVSCLEDLIQRVPYVEIAVGVWRTVVERERLRFRLVLVERLVNAFIPPEILQLGLALDRIRSLVELQEADVGWVL